MPQPFEQTYPNIAWLVTEQGWVELGYLDNGYTHSFARAFDLGGTVRESDRAYPTLDDALRALDDGIAGWRHELGL